MSTPKCPNTAMPNTAMMAPIERLARFMAGAADDPGALFVDGPVTMLDNHPPFLFAGTGAGRRWAASFLGSHPDYEDLRHEFGPAPPTGSRSSGATARRPPSSRHRGSLCRDLSDESFRLSH